MRWAEVDDLLAPLLAPHDEVLVGPALDGAKGYDGFALALVTA